MEKITLPLPHHKKDVQKLETYVMLSEMLNGIASMENNEYSLKNKKKTLKICLSYDRDSMPGGHSSKRTKCAMLKRSFHSGSQGRNIYNSQDMKINILDG